MRAYRLLASAGRLDLQLHEALPDPEPGPGQIRIRVRAASLNRGEFIPGHGLHAAAAAPRPVGAEAAGEVLSVGPGVTGWKPGDRLMGRCQGAFAEQALVDVREALPVPDSMDWPQAGACLLTALVAHDMLTAQGGLAAGQWLLVAGVASGVGVAALQAGKALGARVIGSSGSPAKLQRLEALGLDVGVPSLGPEILAAVDQATAGRGVDLAVDTVGGTVFPACVQALAFEGRLAMVGYVDGVLQAPLDLDRLHARRLRLFGVSNKLRSAEQKAESVAAFRRDWGGLLAAGRLNPLVDRTYPFEQLAEARAAMEAGEHLGKIVLLGA